MWNDDYMLYDFRNDHPYKTDKFEIFIQRVRELKENSVINVEIIDPSTTLSINELKKYNSEEFIDYLLELQEKVGMIDPGTPTFDNMVQITSKIVHGTYKQIKNILTNTYSWAFNAVGGYHHGKPDKAAGGCVLNDMGIAINKLRNEGINEKIAIVDIDYHPHDGTVEFFFNDPKTICLSIHEKGWFDFDDSLSKVYDNIVNVPIKSSNILSDEDYIEIFEEQIISAIKDFQPSMILVVHGVDGHENDSVTYYGTNEKPIALSTTTYARIDRILCGLAKEICEGKLMAVGAGGYSVNDTVDVWVQAVEIFNEEL